MEESVFIKEWATIDFSVRRSWQSVYDPDMMKWTMHHPHAIRRDDAHAYTSLYSWRSDDFASPPVIHYVIFDFDSPMVDLAQEDAINFVRYLEAVHEVDPACLGLYFSGHKGFHVQMPIGVVTKGVALWGVTPAVIRDFALRLGEGFKTMDQNVYDARRLFRLPNAININSGLRKIQLTWQELAQLDTADIRAMAAQPRLLYAVEEPAESASLYELMLTVAETQESASVRRPSASLQDIFAPAATGERNTRATRLSGLLVKAMDDLPLVREVVRMWNRSNAHPMTERELDHIIKGVYERYHSRHTNHYRSKNAVGF